MINRARPKKKPTTLVVGKSSLVYDKAWARRLVEGAQTRAQVDALMGRHSAQTPAWPLKMEAEPCFILQSWDWSETSLVCDVLSLHYGRLFVVAKGAKRATSPWRGLIQPFQALHLTLSGRDDTKHIQHVKWMGSLSPINSEALMSAFYLNELILRLTQRHDWHPGLFEAYYQALYALNQPTTTNPGPILRQFEARLLKACGVLGFPDAIEDDVLYTLVDHHWVVASRETPRERQFAGHLFHALLQERYDTKGLRNLLNEYLLQQLGPHPLRTREVLNALRQREWRYGFEHSGPTPRKSYMTTTSLGPVCLDIEGTVLNENDRRRLAHPLTGMVILFSRNYENKTQLKALCEAIHQARPGIVIAVDHEGGRVQRFRDGFTRIPAMRDIADDEDHVALMEAAGLVLATELREVGVDFSFTPVLDVDHGKSEIIGNRSLGRTPQEVLENAQALLRGLTMGGMASCGKHFPSHGWAEADSHVALPTDERTFEEIKKDAMPYRELKPLTSLMTAHVLYPKIDDKIATFSEKLLKDFLRDELGFDGLVFSDDLSMKGAGNTTITDRAEQALKAGCDMVLVCNDPAAADELLENLTWTNTPTYQKRLYRLTPGFVAPEPLVSEARAKLEAFQARRA